MGFTDEVELHGHSLPQMGPVHRPFRAHQHHEVDALQRGPVARAVAVAFDERVAVVPEPLTAETGITIVGVGEEEGAHAAMVRRCARMEP